MYNAYTGMNKSLRHKGYYTQNIKCLRIRAKPKHERKKGDRIMLKLSVDLQVSWSPRGPLTSTALSLPTLGGVLNASPRNKKKKP